jgi:hypothetical protein
MVRLEFGLFGFFKRNAFGLVIIVFSENLAKGQTPLFKPDPDPSAFRK